MHWYVYNVSNPESSQLVVMSTPHLLKTLYHLRLQLVQLCHPHKLHARNDLSFQNYLSASLCYDEARTHF
jgi:hypothetical protein